MEAVVREAGATPATIGILDGKMVVGMTNEQIAFLAEAQDVAKVSRSDISAVLASGRPRSYHRRWDNANRSAGGHTCFCDGEISGYTPRQRKYVRYLRGFDGTFANTSGGRLHRSEGHP